MPRGPVFKGHPRAIPPQQIIGGGALRTYRVRAVRDDYLIASQYDASAEQISDNIEYVAKDPGLRKTGWDGETHTMHLGTYSFAYSTTQKRVVTDTVNNFVETQVVIPAWESAVEPAVADFPIDVIMVAHVANGTGVTANVEEIVDSAFVEVKGTDGTTITTDVNLIEVGSRYWAREN